MKYIVKEELLKALLDYMLQRPYVEVFHLIQAIQSLQPVQTKEVKKDE